MPEPVALPQQVKDIDTLLTRVQRGDTTVLPALRTVLQQRPELAALLGDMAANVQLCLIGKLTEKNQGMALCIETTMQELTKTLAGPQSSPLETLLVTRVVLDWLYLHIVELEEVGQMGKSRTIAAAEYSHKRIDRAHRRYLRSITALAQVRRLVTPMVSLLQMGLHAHQHLQSSVEPGLP